MNQKFVPTSELETVILAVQQDELPIDALMQLLLSSPVAILVDKHVDPAVGWDGSARPLVFRNAEGTPMLAMFTAEDLAGTWPGRDRRFPYVLRTDFVWILNGMAPGVGLAMNPGHLACFDLPPATVDGLKRQAQANAQHAPEATPTSQV